MKTNAAVAESWSKGEKADSKHLHTDGNEIFSYGLKIGFTANNKKIVINYMGKNAYSQTTSHHVSMAKMYADEVIDPNVYKDKYLLQNEVKQ
jgi:hypothetical protein